MVKSTLLGSILSNLLWPVSEKSLFWGEGCSGAYVKSIQSIRNVTMFLLPMNDVELGVSSIMLIIAVLVLYRCQVEVRDRSHARQ